MKIYYTVYKIINKINGKFYIGTHKTCNLDDGYMGSGKYLKRAIAKHGIKNFEKEILFVFDTSEEMFAKEAEIVNEDFLAESNTYNLRIGGMGGFDYINGNLTIQFKYDRAKAGRIAANAKGAHLKGSIKGVESLKKLWKEGKLKPPVGFKGHKHSNRTKKLIGDVTSRSQRGNLNSQYNTIWITNGKENKKIHKDEKIPKDWYRGRTLH